MLNKVKLSIVIIFNGVFLLTSVGFFYKYFKNKKKIESKYPKYMVILHQYSRGLRAPSLSPHPLKIETWLRIANIKYEVFLVSILNNFYLFS
jgi:hypothetical protein